MRFNNRWGEIDYINEGVIGVKCKIVNDYTGTSYEYIQVYLSTKESSGSYYASPKDISLALGYYYKQKTNRGIYSRQWAAETNGIFYDMSGMSQYDVFGGRNGPIDIITFIDNMGPQWEATFLAKTSEDFLNEMQLGLDVCSCFPILFLPLTGTNILISFARGNTRDALIRAGVVVGVSVAAKVVSVVVKGALKSAIERCGSDTALMKSTVEAVAEAMEEVAPLLKRATVAESENATLLINEDLASLGTTTTKADIIADAKLAVKDYVVPMENTSGLYGYNNGITANQIRSINNTFGGNIELNGSIENALENATRYESFWEKTAAITRSIVANHTFDNGNKRTALAVIQELMARNNVSTGVNIAQMRQVIYDIATGTLTDIEQIAKALRGF